ncbi:MULTISPECIES: 4Fe-4S binding protein [unclassified Oceanispirochaeta]|uniref:4Fe-4S binding protein n=1 Tax=unclassified Oceanispirochaeta TaxID=2635722 RepID=UPI0018F648C1|nr:MULTISPECIES: 4Fe-4S binding protein [unclassified Oceanispirochaeta]
MTIKEIYEKFEATGVLTASTILGDEVHSRIMHFNGYDEEGIYFRTMGNKPFGRQLKDGKKITVCGIDDARVLGHNEDGVPEFPPGYFVRLVGEIKYLDEAAVREKAETNKAMELAVYDMEHYPMMKEGNFVIYKAKGEVFDYDFGCKTRDHKLLRTRFEFGGMPFNKVGPTITESCIECGACFKNCTFKAIEEGSPYRVISQRCDDCGTCIVNCPVNAIELSNAL